MTESAPGTLFVVSTPIGNMGDFSFRAVDVLQDVSAILAEDTRHTRNLLDRYKIKTRMVSYHEHNEAKTTPGLVARLTAGESLALVSDAGTPLLSDPGARLVSAALDAGVTVSPIPGASAILAALVTSGLSTERFTFVGFLPRKGEARRVDISEIVAMRHVAVVFESPSRVGDTLAELAEAGAGDRATVVARELTKQFEEVRRGTMAELAAYYLGTPPRGEIVIVIDGAAAPADVSDADLRARAIELRAAGHDAREVMRVLTSELGASRNQAYRLAHEK